MLLCGLHCFANYQERINGCYIAAAVNIANAEIKAAGYAGKNELVKVLGNGEIKTAVTVTADAFSKSAISKIEAAGGKAVVNE